MARKMLLVDPRMMPTVSANEPPVPDVLSDVIRRLDGNIEGILRNGNLPLSEKVKRYNDVLKGYLDKTDDYRDQRRLPSENLSALRSGVDALNTADNANWRDVVAGADPGPEGAVGVGGGGLNDAGIVSMISDKFRGKGRRLLSFLKNVPNLTWTERGEVRIGDRVYRDSHIVDLISHSVKPARRGGGSPSGWQAFMDILKQSNVPRDLLSSHAHGMKPSGVIGGGGFVPASEFEAVTFGLPSPSIIGTRSKRGRRVVSPAIGVGSVSKKWTALRRGRRL